MKRDWDVIRDVLVEVEALPLKDRHQFIYEVGEGPRGDQAWLLWKAGFLDALETSNTGGEAIISPSLTWAGHELLDTMRSKPVWERVTAAAKSKGVELTFEAVKMLATAALKQIFGADS